MFLPPEGDRAAHPKVQRLVGPCHRLLERLDERRRHALAVVDRVTDDVATVHAVVLGQANLAGSVVVDHHRDADRVDVHVVLHHPLDVAVHPGVAVDLDQGVLVRRELAPEHHRLIDLVVEEVLPVIVVEGRLGVPRVDADIEPVVLVPDAVFAHGVDLQTIDALAVHADDHRARTGQRVRVAAVDVVDAAVQRAVGLVLGVRVVRILVVVLLVPAVVRVAVPVAGTGARPPVGARTARTSRRRRVGDGRLVGRLKVGVRTSEQSDQDHGHSPGDWHSRDVNP